MAIALFEDIRDYEYHRKEVESELIDRLLSDTEIALQ